MQYGECNIHSSFKQQFNIQEGATVYFTASIGRLMNSIIDDYNIYAEENDLLRINQVKRGTIVQLPCKVKNFTTGTYGKFPNTEVNKQQMMEISNFQQLLVNYMSDALIDQKEFLSFLQNRDLIKMEEFSDQLMMTLPHPRADYYADSDFNVI